MPSGVAYDFVAGVWKDQNDFAIALDPKADRHTKKMDVETGEDQKGQ